MALNLSGLGWALWTSLVEADTIYDHIFGMGEYVNVI